MQIKEITIAELPDFVRSELWQQLTPKPLTSLRAISQFHNPRANPNDIALIIAYENNILVGLVGLLPDLINGLEDQKVSSNTCWWVNPEKGKQLAIPLFLKAFALCDQKMFMTDCTPHTKSILEKTNWFDFPDTIPGIRGFLKLNLNEVIPAKFPSTQKLKPLLKLTDQIFNFLLIPYRKIVHLRIKKDGPEVEYLVSLDEELHTFIERHSQNEFTRRSGKDLEWIIQNQWIKGKTQYQPFPSVDYPFSYIVGNFEQYFVRVTESGKTIGLLLFSIRDGHMKVPYVYFHEENARQILKVIYRQALLKKAVTLTIYYPKLVSFMDSVSHPFIFKKKIKRLIALSNELSFSYKKHNEFQDGDGDVVFT
jgi:hypothetical protein